MSNHIVKFQGFKWLALFLFTLPIFSYAATEIKPYLIFSVTSNHVLSSKQKNYTANLILENCDPLQPGIWKLAFNFIRPIDAIDPGKIIDHIGDFYIIQFELAPHTRQIIFKLSGSALITHLIDNPRGFFLIKENKNNPKHPQIIYPIKIIIQTLPKDPLAQDQLTNETTPINSSQTLDNSLIVPLPVELEKKTGNFILNTHTHIIFEPATARKEVDFFNQAIQPAVGYQLTSQSYTPNTPLKNTIVLIHKKLNDLNNNREAYQLEINPSTIKIFAATNAGFFYAFQTLRQLLPPDIYSKTKVHHEMGFWKIPSLYIYDYPRFEYRGLLLDVARHFIAGKEIERLLDLMAIHKLNYFQWHLTDDEGWRIEIKKYPELTTVGAWRGYQPNKQYSLPPAYGSGAKLYGGYYTQKEVRDIIQYAAERHITIIPEIDIPGHARALIMSLPKELMAQEDHLPFSSAQGYHDNILSPCKKNTFIVLDNIISEIAKLFPGPYIHTGGDEVPDNAWLNSCMKENFSKEDPLFKAKVQNEFMKKVQAIIIKYGKIMAGWEEVASNVDTLTSPLLVDIWNTEKIAAVYKKSLQEGYKIVLGPAENFYFDQAYEDAPNEPGQNWAGYVNTFSVYSFIPLKADQNSNVIKGLQGHLWTEFIDTQDRLDYMAFPRVAALAELAWSPANRLNWKNFSRRMQQLHLLRLGFYGVKYRRKF